MFKTAVCWLVLCLAFISRCRANGRSIYGKNSVYQRSVSPNGLTIFSFAFNPSHIISEWVETLFGDKSVHFHSVADSKKISSFDPLSASEIQSSHLLISNMLSDFINQPALLYPKCSIELLGTIILDKYESFRRNSDSELRNISIPIGEASLSFHLQPGNVHQWKCYYRAMHENWKPENDHSSPNYWSVMFYCPQLRRDLCDVVRHSSVDRANLTVDMKLNHDKSKVVQNSFVVDISNLRSTKGHRVKKLANNPLKARQFSANTIGVCLAIPYTTTDIKKRLANDMMLTEWMKYYVSLEMPIFMFDSTGHNFGLVQNVTDRFHLNHIYYYNYTIRDQLVSNLGGLVYDNNEMTETMNGGNSSSDGNSLSVEQRYYIQGVDKTMTLTHCRFEAKAVYGIDQVLVVDFDEFFYCPRGEFAFQYPEENVLQLEARNHTKISSYVQSTFIHYIAANARVGGFKQMSIGQRVLANKTASNRECVINQVLQQQSIFDCLSSQMYYIDRHSTKAIHLGHYCPLTGYHQACPTRQSPRAFDCLCDTKDLDEWICTLIHFTTNEEHSNKPQVLVDDDVAADETHMALMRESVNEIKIILEEHYS